MSGVQSDPSCPAESGAICARRHWSVYGLILVVALGLAAGRVLTVRNGSTRGESPFFSANDRSRWCTVHALVDYGTFELDPILQRPSPIHWDTIDKVQHLGADGQLHFYSSKPPLLSVLVAGPYWVLQRLVGWRLDEDPLAVVRVLLLVVNVIPFGWLLWSLAGYLERQFVADWTRYFILSAAAFATPLTTFLVTLNNHLPAAVAVMFVLDGLDRLHLRGQRGALGLADGEGVGGWGSVSAAAGIGLGAGLATAFELPALALAAAAWGMVWRLGGWRSALAFGLPLALVAGAYLAAGYAAHGRWEIAYAHRSDGAVAAAADGSFSTELDAGRFPEPLIAAVTSSSLQPVWSEMKVPRIERGSWMGQSASIQGRWVVRDQAGPNQFVILQTGSTHFELRHWNNWYDYPGSYWSTANERRSAVDRGQPDRLLYLFHVLFGHHGILTLTPLWIFSTAGLVALAISRSYGQRWLGIGGLALTFLVIAFYVSRPEHDRNYGGQTSALRWTFWLIPIWLAGLVPVVQGWARTTAGRGVCFLFLLASLLSAAYAADNPWVHPWLYEIWDWTGLPR